MKKIMLIYPPGKLYQRSEDRAQSNISDSAASSVHACNDLGYAAALLIREGYDVFLKDYQTELLSKKDVQKDVLIFKPDLILISITNATIIKDIAFANWIYSFYKCKFVLKGAVFFNIDNQLLETLDLKCIDCLIGGEIDTVISSVADALLYNKQNMISIPGIVFKNTDGCFQKTSFNYWNNNLDDVPFPARHLMNNNLYKRPDTGEPMATIQVSRGCPASCIYCLTPIISGKRVRYRSVENVYCEIEECYYKHNIRNFFFKADTFTIDYRWANELCDMLIASPLHGKIQFTVNSRTNTIDIKLLKKLKEAGCFMIAVGFESGCDTTMQKIKKGATVKDSIACATMIREAGIPLFGFFMIGFPWETYNDTIKTLKFMFTIDPDFIELHIAMPYYGTELYSECQKYDTLFNEAWGSDYFSPNTKGTQTVSLETLKKLKREYLLRFYLRPKYLIGSLIKCIKNPPIFKNYARYAIRLVRNNLFGIDNNVQG